MLHKYFFPNTSRLLKLQMTFSIWIFFKDELLKINEQGRILLPSFWILLGNEILVIDVLPEKALYQSSQHYLELKYLQEMNNYKKRKNQSV